ncbi:MAG: hypothetical protein NWE79_07915 [Candidatus Bathyarchaeota archaeon]|jgi:hypothetical protein|nr:hypothetical protein [Candidatus Bathyarchaeota archaeon]
MAEGSSLGERLENIPLWVFFLLIVGAMAYITLNPLGLPIPVTAPTKDTFNEVEKLNEGDIMLIDSGYASGTIAVHEPGLVVVFKHAMRKGVKMVVVSSAIEGPLLFDRAVAKARPETRGYEYGRDYIHLGYFSGGEPAYAGIIADITAVFSVDYKNTPVSQLELWNELSPPTFEKISLVYVQSAGGDVCEGWIRQSAVRYDLPMIQQPLEMMVPTILPYYPINCQGILNGGIGAAEYEAFAGLPGEAVKLSDMLSMGGLVVLIFLIIGNIGWFMRPRR